MDILVSSTYEDLKEERAAARATIGRLEHAVGMEDFPASSELSRDECMFRLRACDAVVLIIGDHYGSIDPKTGYSVTELEYRTAKELGLPIFAFLKVGDDDKWRSVEADPEKHAKHEAFKRLVDSELTRQTFHTAEDLKSEVVIALAEHAKLYGRIGVRGSVFQAPTQFFQKYSDPARIFNHTFPLVGRRAYVEQVRDSLSTPQRVILLPGIGGIGKSRILQAGLAELQSTHPDVTVCLLAEGSAFTQEHASELPDGQIVIVVEDVHRVAGIDELLAFAQQFPERIRLVFTTRPHGLPKLQQDLVFAGFDSLEILELPEAKALTYSEVEQLAREIVGEEMGSRLAQLVAVSRDSPLITVIAGQLLKREQLDPSLLAKGDSEAFRLHVLARFRDELLGNIAPELNSSRAREVLKLLAAIAPANSVDTQLVERAAAFLEIKPDELRAAIDVLESSGILHRRSGQLRITPDVLADYILQEACFTTNRHPTGYSKRIFDAFGDLVLRAVLLNMAELDWRVSPGTETALLQEAWRDLREQYVTAGAQGRLTLLELVASLAYFQPGEALAFVRLAFQLSSPVDATGIPSAIDEATFQALAPILREVAYYPAYAREAAELLWRIGCDDARLLDTVDDHPIRILRDLAAYARHKPLAYNELLYDWLEEQAYTKDAFQHHYSPLDILPVLLQREGTETWTQGRTLFMSGFLVSPAATAEFRQRVLTLMRTLGLQNGPDARRNVVKTLVNAILRGIMGLGSARPTTEQVAAWQDEDLTILSMLADLLAAEENPAVMVDVEDDLIAIAADPRHAAISDDVTRLINQLPQTLESTLIRYLRQGRFQRRLMVGQQNAKVNRDALEDALEPELAQTLESFFATYPTPEEIKRELERLFGFLTDANANSSERYLLLQRLCRREPDAMLAVCELLVKDAGSQALSCLPVLLTELREHDFERILNCLRVAETSSSLEIRRIAAWAIGIPRPIASEEEQRIIRQFALDADIATALGGIQALQRFPTERHEDVVAILDDIVVGDDGALANRICQLFDAQLGIDPENLSQPFIASMLEKLVPLADWSQLSHVSDFIAWVTAAYPESAANYYLARIAYQHKLTSDDSNPGKRYMAVPYSTPTEALGAQPNTANEGARARALRAVRDSTLQVEGMGSMTQVTEVYKRLSQHYAIPALDVLMEWIDSGEPQKIVNAARLLHEAEHNFVFAQEAYVAHLLEAAHKCGKAVFQEVQAWLSMSAQSGMSAGWVGAPDPKDEALRDKAAAFAQRYPRDHVAHQFYNLLHKSAIDAIERNRRLAELLENGE